MDYAYLPWGQIATFASESDQTVNYLISGNYYGAQDLNPKS